MAVLRTDPKTIIAGNPTILDIEIMNATSMTPSQGLNITASISMAAMPGMALAHPKVTSGSKSGHYNVQINFPEFGEYKLDLAIKSSSDNLTPLSFKITPGRAVAGAKSDMNEMQSIPGMKPMDGAKDMQGLHNMHGMPGMQMKSFLGNWSANREGSGTSWQPDSSPMLMTMLKSFGGFDIGAMGTIQAGYVNAGGKRGEKDFFSNSMIMLMARKDMGGGTLGLHLMSSLDPFLNGQRGVPNLFQNGFTVHGIDINDRKDPHNIFAELASSYSHPLSRDLTGFLYGGPVGEPALGNVMYLHRLSGLEIPEAPISHDWFDGSHISFGVATIGDAYQNKWKLEGSLFNSDEPGAHLYGIGRIALNSVSGRLSYNPSRDWSFNTAYGYLNSDVKEHRLTIGAAYSHDLSNGDNLSATAYFGQNIAQGSTNSNAWLAEATYYHANEAFFARFERVDKGELVDVPMGNYTINKFLFGDVHTLCRKDQLDYGLGAYAGVYSFPSSLNPFYGKNPITFGLFFRIRPSKR